jgi:two-component system sensor histidine kinase EvgS
VAVDLAPVFPWRRHLPLIVVSVLGLLATAAGTAWWIRRLAREVKARRRSEARLRDIGAALPCAAFRHVFEDGQVLASWVSPNTATLLALPVPAGRTVLACLAERLAAEQQALLLAQQDQCLQGGEPLHASVAYSHPDGRTRWLGCQAVCTPAEGRALALTGVIVDLSDEHELQARLVHAAQQRNLMLASASHELRAPAHTLALALQALHATDLPDAAQGPLHIARDAVDTLSQLLGDVLDAARLEGAPLRLRARPMDLPGFLHDVAAGAAITARAKGLAFDSKFDPGLPARAMQDPLRLKQLLINLLSNAFKYTPAGHVSLRASVQCAGVGAAEAARLLRLDVADTGPGIDPAMQARLFTPFADDDSASRPRPSEGSSGLGLVICRDLAAQMGGHLELTSEPGHGTRATLLLPLMECPAEPVAAPREGVVLVCDDDITSQLLLAQLLRNAGYAVEETATGADVLARCARGGVAAVITDLHMPGMDGAELLCRLRSAAPAAGAGPLLVLCSGDLSVPDPAAPAAAEGAVEASNTGARDLADAHLAKPVDLQALQQVLRQGGVHPHPPPTAN